MEKINTQHFKEKLLEEKKKLISELETVGRINPDNPTDWEPVPAEKMDKSSDVADMADSITDYEENTALVKELEIQLGDVNAALEKIENGKYGICEVSGEQIEVKRLEANPAARTCIEHMGK